MHKTKVKQNEESAHFFEEVKLHACKTLSSRICKLYKTSGIVQNFSKAVTIAALPCHLTCFYLNLIILQLVAF